MIIIFNLTGEGGVVVNFSTPFIVLIIERILESGKTNEKK